MNKKTKIIIVIVVIVVVIYFFYTKNNTTTSASSSTPSIPLPTIVPTTGIPNVSMPSPVSSQGSAIITPLVISAPIASFGAGTSSASIQSGIQYADQVTRQVLPISSAPVPVLLKTPLTLVPGALMIPTSAGVMKLNAR